MVPEPAQLTALKVIVKSREQFKPVMIYVGSAMKKSDFNKSRNTPIQCIQHLDLIAKTAKLAAIIPSFYAEKIKCFLGDGRGQLLTLFFTSGDWFSEEGSLLFLDVQGGLMYEICTDSTDK